jgi:hypothetical protein
LTLTLSQTTLSHMDMDMVVVGGTVPRSTLHFTGITGWVRLDMKTKTRGHLFLPTSQCGEFALGESECFLKEDRGKLLDVLDGPHFPGAFA